jgi:polysaccharide biosynthesis transport protein
MIKDNSPELPNGQDLGNGARFSPQVQMAPKPSTLAEQDQRQHFAALLSSLRRVWRIAVPLGICLAAVGSFAAWKTLVPLYSASAFLRVDGDSRPLLFKTADEAAGRGTDFRLYKNTHQQLLMTPFVLNAALRAPEVAALKEIANEDDPVGWLKQNLKVGFPGDGEIMQVSVETVSPTSCITLANGIVDAFMKEVVMNDRGDRLRRLETLEKVFSERTSEVRNRQVELKNLAATLGTSDTDSLTVAQQNALQQFGKSQEKLGEVQFLLMQAEGELKIAEEMAQRQIAEENARRQNETETALDTETSSTIGSEAAVKMAERSPDVVRLEEEISVAQAELNSISKVYGTSHPTVQKATEAIAIKNQLLNKRVADAIARAKLEIESQQQAEQKQDSQSKRSQILRTPGGGYIDLAGLASKAQVLANQEKILREKVVSLSEETRQLGKSSIDVELMRSEISGLETVLRTIGDEIERTTVELKTASRIRLISPAVKAAPPDSMKRISRSVGLGILGLFAPLGLLAIWDFSRRRVDTVDEVSQSLSLPTIATIPLVSKNPLERPTANSLIETDRVQAGLDEAVDALASMILYSSQIENRQVFMVCSAMPGEGKSTVSCQLAQSLARAGKSVALVDFDLRRPCVHRYMDLPLEPGIAQSLYGQKSFEETLQKTVLDNLSVMAAGDWSGNLQERCTAGAMTDLFDYLRANFELVVVDSSPVLPVHDACVVGKYTDGVILTLVRDKSRLPASARACEVLRSYGVLVLGTVIIGGRHSGQYRKYGYGYGYGYGGYGYGYGGYGKKPKTLVSGK